MDICGACRHVQALHAGQTGHCRLNGCHCAAFSTVDHVFAEEPFEAPDGAGKVLDGLYTLMIAAGAFIAGIVVGQNL